MLFVTIEEAITEIQEGRMVIIVDDEDRENGANLFSLLKKSRPRLSTSWRLTAEVLFASP